MPGVAQVVSIGVCYSNQCLYSIDVLLLHLCDAGASCEQSKPGQGLDVCVPFQLHTHRKEKQVNRIPMIHPSQDLDLHQPKTKLIKY